MGCYLIYCQFIINLHLDFLSSLIKFYFFFFYMYMHGNKAISFYESSTVACDMFCSTLDENVNEG